MSSEFVVDRFPQLASTNLHIYTFCRPTPTFGISQASDRPYQALGFDTMTSLRPFRATDLFNLSLTNLDPLTENYDMSFYHQYMATWPEMFTVAEDMDGNIVGYSMFEPLLSVIMISMSCNLPGGPSVCTSNSSNLLN